MTYLERIARAIQSGAVPAGSVATASVLHEHDCAIWADGPCSCVPDVFIDGPEGRAYVLADGSVARGEDPNP